VVGLLVNGALIGVTSALFPPPAGVDQTTLESFAATIHLLQTQHFVSPFIAHAGGTFAGTLVSMFIAISNRRTLALILGGIFLTGGIIACVLIPAPKWFMAVDLILAYIPMSLLAWKISGKP
jgi:hypothetical protein